MHLRFDLDYIRGARQHVAMVLLNSVRSDSRILKMAYIELSGFQRDLQRERLLKYVY